MSRQIVSSSSNIAALDFDEASNTLTVEFVNDTIYRYTDVPKSVHEAFLAADSKGRFFNVNIRSAYKGEKVS